VQCYYASCWQPMSLPAWEFKTMVITLTLEVCSDAVADDIMNSVATPEGEGEFITHVNEFFKTAYGENAVSVPAIDADIL
jgi:hypothetical protein